MPRLSTLLLGWYKASKRALPWRDHPDPYAVWVSEIMCQQTRVETVVPYFEKWMKQFPSVKALASASERDVLAVWEGLGYYSRARNLRRAAKIVVEKFGGRLPSNLEDLRSLPGIGRYTVGAIASLAFKMDEPTLDGNIRRVFSRLFDVKGYADSPGGEKILWALAGENLPKGRAGDYNQALMDLGAMVCLPKNPRCSICPLKNLCKAQRNGTQEMRPTMKPKKRIPTYVHAAAVIVERGRVLLSQRPADGLLGGMWEFPNARIDGDPARELVKALRGATRLKVRVEARGGRSQASAHGRRELGTVSHAYSHFRVAVYPFWCEKVEIPKDKNLKWVKLKDLEDYPMGKVERQIARQIK